MTTRLAGGGGNKVPAVTGGPLVKVGEKRDRDGGRWWWWQIRRKPGKRKGIRRVKQWEARNQKMETKNRKSEGGEERRQDRKSVV